MKHELQNIISGKSQVRHGAAIQAIANYLREGKSSSTATKSSKQIKSEEATLIKHYCDQNNFWVSTIDSTTFVSSGAEQKVYLHDKHKVIKLNDSIYYETC
jgi:Serine/Threonine/Tyrosine Kinase found in polyvalent proteins